MKQVHKSQQMPSGFLVQNIDLLPRGRALDIAMGSGRNSIYLAKMGFDVQCVDISPQAVETAMCDANAADVKIRANTADLERDYKIQQNSFDVIICFNYLQRDLIDAIKKGVRSGGMVVYETFIIDQVRFGKPRNPDHLLQHNELLQMFHDFRCLRYYEGIVENRKASAGIK